MQTEVKVGHWYNHFKGKEYVVLAIALHHNNLEPWVVYSNVSENPDDVNAYIRPVKEFLEIMPDGVQRFTLKSIKDRTQYMVNLTSGGTDVG